MGPATVSAVSHLCHGSVEGTVPGAVIVGVAGLAGLRGGVAVFPDLDGPIPRRPVVGWTAVIGKVAGRGQEGDQKQRGPLATSAEPVAHPSIPPVRVWPCRLGRNDCTGSRHSGEILTGTNAAESCSRGTVPAGPGLNSGATRVFSRSQKKAPALNEPGLVKQLAFHQNSSARLKRADRIPALNPGSRVAVGELML